MTPPRGIALPAVLMALVALGFLAAAVFTSALAELDGGRAALASQEALAHAEGAADSIVQSWDRSTYAGLPVGGVNVTESQQEHSGFGRTVTVFRTGVSYLVLSVEARRGPARQGVSLIVHVGAPVCQPQSGISHYTIISSTCIGGAVRRVENGWVGAF